MPFSVRTTDVPRMINGPNKSAYTRRLDYFSFNRDVDFIYVSFILEITVLARINRNFRVIRYFLIGFI